MKDRLANNRREERVYLKSNDSFCLALLLATFLKDGPRRQIEKRTGNFVHDVDEGTARLIVRVWQTKIVAKVIFPFEVSRHFLQIPYSIIYYQTLL